jgi:hypothetical protein
MASDENGREITALTGDELTQQQLDAVNGGMTLSQICSAAVGDSPNPHNHNIKHERRDFGADF